MNRSFLIVRRSSVCSKLVAATKSGLAIVCLAVLAGCDDMAPKAQPAAEDSTPRRRVASDQFIAPTVILDEKPSPSTTAETPKPQEQTEPEKPKQPEAPAASSVTGTPGATTEKVRSGIGIQGQGYADGLITTPVREYFSIRDRIVYDQIRHDLDIWKALHGRFPKDPEEFEREILKPANIELPELPHGKTYYYDGQKGELYMTDVKPQN